MLAAYPISILRDSDKLRLVLEEEVLDNLRCFVQFRVTRIIQKSTPGHQSRKRRVELIAVFFRELVFLHCSTGVSDLVELHEV